MKYLGPPQSGSVAAQTFSRNRYGQYTRARAGRGGTGAAAMTTIVAGWQTLTDAQRLAWQAYASANPYQKHNVPDRVQLSGYDMFMRVNLGTFANSTAVVQTDPPELSPGVTWGYMTGFSAAIVGTDIEVSWTDLSGDFGQFILYSSGPVTAGTMSPPGRGLWWRRFFGVGWDSSTTFPPQSTVSQWQTIWTRVVGDYFYVAARNCLPGSVPTGPYLWVRLQW